MRTGCKLFLAAAAMLGASAAALADEGQVARGKYLVTLGGCNDCHTPGAFLGKPDFSRALSGSEVGFAIPGLGVFVGPNLTPDKETGLGNWTDDQVIAAFAAGVTPDGRRLALVDAQAVEAFALGHSVFWEFAVGQLSAELLLRAERFADADNLAEPETVKRALLVGYEQIHQ